MWSQLVVLLLGHCMLLIGDKRHLIPHQVRRLAHHSSLIRSFCVALCIGGHQRIRLAQCHSHHVLGGWPGLHLVLHRLLHQLGVLLIRSRRRSRAMYPLPTELLNKYAHFVGFLPILPVVPCLCARLLCLLRQKFIKIRTM